MCQFVPGGSQYQIMDPAAMRNTREVVEVDPVLRLQSKSPPHRSRVPSGHLRTIATPSGLHCAVGGSPGAVLSWKKDDRQAWKTEPHEHTSGQLFSLDRGSAAMEAGGASWLLVPGRVGWIPPGQTHSMTSHGNVSGWSLYLPAEQSALLPQHALIFLRSVLLEQIVVRIARSHESRIAPERVGRLLSVLADEMTQSVSDGTHLPLPHDSRLTKLIRQFSQTPAAQHSLNYWAREIGMSKRSLTRIFQQQTGLSLGEWIQNFRISLAAERLAAGYDVTAAALASGYTSISAFTKVFDSIIGTTPARYRRMAMDKTRVISKQASLQDSFAEHGESYPLIA
jgi:AraC-like DNA-binding protein/mannose-6-phosphate isomerase-like protein (cupin superfamily)